MVRFLLEAGADQEHKTDEMHTALMEASMDGHVEVARLLLDSGAQVSSVGIFWRESINIKGIKKYKYGCNYEYVLMTPKL